MVVTVFGLQGIILKINGILILIVNGYIYLFVD